jgi:hypothetical protein
MSLSYFYVDLMHNLSIKFIFILENVDYMNYNIIKLSFKGSDNNMETKDERDIDPEKLKEFEQYLQQLMKEYEAAL